MAFITKKNLHKVSTKDPHDLSDQLKNEYVALWNDPDFKNRFCNRMLTSGSKTGEWILERNKYKKSKATPKGCKTDEIPCIEISERVFNNSPLLFIGMNPSGTFQEDFAGNTADVFAIGVKGKYYQAIMNFTKECVGDKNCFSELDLFGIIQSKQSVIEQDFKKNPDYYKEMFALFLEYVVLVQPKVIIVTNALASKILRRDKSLRLNQPKYDNFYKGAKYHLTPNARFGGYTFTIGEFTCQLYFSSMLSGQHALDKGSRENLVWLVKNYLR